MTKKRPKTKLYHWEVYSKMAGTKPNLVNLWMDIARDCDQIFINQIPLSEYFRNAGELKLEPDSNNIPGMIAILKNIIKEQLLSHLDESIQDQVASEFITHLSQIGIGYIAGNSINSQILQTESLFPTDKLNSMHINSMADGSLEVISTGAIINAREMINGAPIGRWVVDEANKIPLVSGYTKTRVTFDGSTVTIEPAPKSILFCSNLQIQEEFEKLFVNAWYRDEYCNKIEAPTVKKQLTPEERHFADEVLLMQLTDAQAQHLYDNISKILGDYEKYLQDNYKYRPSSAHQKKLAIVSGLLNDGFIATSPYQQRLLHIYQILDKHKDVFSQHADPQELDIWSRIKQFFSTITFFGLVSPSATKGALMISEVNTISRNQFSLFNHRERASQPSSETSLSTSGSSTPRDDDEGKSESSSQQPQ